MSTPARLISSLPAKHVPGRKPGRPITVKARPWRAQDLIRRHLREHGLELTGTMQRIWGFQNYQSVYHLLGPRGRLRPKHIEPFITAMGLDDFDANELRLAAAREDGWNINPAFLLK